MIDSAFSAGAWGAKIQTFFADDLSDKWQHKFEHYKALELSWDDHQFFVDRCYNLGLVPLTTIYDAKYLTQLRHCGFRHIKIGSAEAVREHLIRQALMNKMRVFVSTGGREVHEIPNLPGVHCYMHCVSSYPGNIHDADLSRIFELKQAFPKRTIGFSDHTTPFSDDGHLPSFIASAMGVQYIEKHFTVLPRDKVKDGHVSLDIIQLRRLCAFDKATPKEKFGHLGNIPLNIIYNYKEAVDKEKERRVIREYSTRWKT
jgi:sialic acid synthase SpsE